MNLKKCPFCKNKHLELVLEKKVQGNLEGREAYIKCLQSKGGCGKIIDIGWFAHTWNFDHILSEVTKIWNSRKNPVWEKIKKVVGR